MEGRGERKRYPQYDHTAVIVAEDVKSRFLNVISLFNGFIPLVAIQLNAIQVESQVSLISTIVSVWASQKVPQEASPRIRTNA